MALTSSDRRIPCKRQSPMSFQPVAIFLGQVIVNPGQVWLQVLYILSEHALTFCV
jgi:hypothetical protein